MKPKTIQPTEKSFLVFLTKTLLPLLLFCFFTHLLTAQNKVKILPGVMVQDPIGEGDSNTKYGVKAAQAMVYSNKKAAKGINDDTNAGQTAIFDLILGSGFDDNPEAKAAFEFAIDIWASELVSNVPIRVDVDLVSLPQGILAGAGPSYTALGGEDSDALKPGIVYPAALANALAGEVLGPEIPSELRVQFSSNVDFYFGLDGNTPDGQFDFVSIALHELGHGLGFISLNGPDALDFRSLGGPDVYVNLLVDGNGRRLTSYTDGSEELRQALIGDNLFADGSNTVAAFQGELPKIEATDPFRQGSTTTHWDEVAFPAGDSNSLMSPRFGTAESIFDIGNITRGFLKDMGWQLNNDIFPITVTALDFPDTIDKGETLTRTITITNTVDREITINAVLEGTPEAVLITNTDAITIAPLESLDLEVVLATENLDKGFYDQSLAFSVDESEALFKVSDSFRILDGTEKATVEVPEVITAEINLNEITEIDFVLNNIGDADLTYTLSVEDTTADFITLNEPEGTIALESSANTTLQFDTNGLEEGDYEATLVISSNDPDQPEVRVPLAITVRIFTPPTIAVTPDSVSAFRDLARPLPPSIGVTVTNNGELPLEFKITQDNPLFGIIGEENKTGVLEKDESITLGLLLTRASCPDLRLDDNYLLNLLVESNDPANPVVTIPVDYTLSSKRGVFDVYPSNPTYGNVFGPVRVGTVARETFTYRNNGLAPIVITSLEGGIVKVLEWKSTSGDSIVDPGEDLIIDAEFAPTEPSASFQSITIRTEISEIANCLITRLFPHLAVETLPELKVSDDAISSSIDFDNNFDGNPIRQETFVVENVGDGPMRYFVKTENPSDVIQLNGLDVSGSVLVDPGERRTVVVTFDATSAEEGIYTNNLIVSYNLQASLVPPGDSFGDAEFMAGPPAIIATSFDVKKGPIGQFGEVADLDFGEGATGETMLINSSLENIGDAPINIASMLTNLPEYELVFYNQETLEEVSFDEVDKTIAPGANWQFGVVYLRNRRGGGESNGRITIENNSVQSPFTIDLSGSSPVFPIGRFPTFPPFNIEEAVIGESRDGFLFIVNEGDAPITMTDFGIDNPEFSAIFFNAAFEEVTFEELDKVLPIGDGLIVTVRYTPTKVGEAKGTFAITSDAFQEVFTIELLGTGVAPPAEITSFSLVEAFTGEILKDTIVDGDIIDLAGQPVVSIIANTGFTEPGSVVFGYNDRTVVRTENSAPYAIGGDFSGRILPFTILPGNHFVFATPYTEPNGGGEAEDASGVFFTVINSDLPSITELVLINADTDEEIEVLQTGDVLNDFNLIDVSAYENNAFNIVAKTDDPRIEFVTFDYNDQQNYRFERVAPYALQGDFNGDYRPLAFENGFNIVTAIPNGNRRFGNPLTVYFTVEGAANTAAKNAKEITTTSALKVTPNPVSSVANFSIVTKDVSTLKGRLVNLLGQDIDLTKRLAINSDGTGTLDMQGLAAGQYFLFVTDLTSGVSYNTIVAKE